MFYIATPEDLNFPKFSEREVLSAGHATAITSVNKLKVSTTREVKNKSEVKFLKKYRLHAAQPGTTDIVLLFCTKHHL